MDVELCRKLCPISYPTAFINPCRLCSHVVVVIGLVCVNDPWGYAVELLMSDRSKVRRQTKWDTGVYDARGLWRSHRSAHQM